MGKIDMIYIGFNSNLRRLFLGLTIALMCFIAVKSLTPAIPSLSISNIDKVAHMLAYLALGAVALPAFSRVKPVYIWLILCIFGACIEIMQGLMSMGRSVDFWDAIANAGGALLAVIGWLILTHLAKKLA